MEPRHRVSVITVAYTSLYLIEASSTATPTPAPAHPENNNRDCVSIKAPLGAPGFCISDPREVSVGAKTSAADSAPFDSGTVYPQPRVFSALANIRGMGCASMHPKGEHQGWRPSRRECESLFWLHCCHFPASSDRRRPWHLDRRVTEKHEKKPEYTGCRFHPLMC
jgi:hypothetical protein